MNSSNFRCMQLLKVWPWHRKFNKSLILALLSFTPVSHIPYYVNFRFNNGPNMSSVPACFLHQLLILEACSCWKNDHDTVNLVSHWYSIDSLLVRSVIFRITSTSGLIMDQICHYFLHAFSVNSGVILFFCRSILCYVFEKCVKVLTEVKNLKTVFNVFIFGVLKSDVSKFWQLVCKLMSIRLISFNDFIKMEGPKTKFMQ